MTDIVVDVLYDFIILELQFGNVVEDLPACVTEIGLGGINEVGLAHESAFD